MPLPRHLLLSAVTLALAATAVTPETSRGQQRYGSGRSGSWGGPLFNFNRRATQLASQASPSVSDRPSPPARQLWEEPPPSPAYRSLACDAPCGCEGACRCAPPCACEGPCGCDASCECEIPCGAGGCVRRGFPPGGRGNACEVCASDCCTCELTWCPTDCDTGCYVPRNWFSADYLGWWTKGNHLPALVTTSPAGTPRVDAGVVGVAGTQVLFGNSAIDDEYRSGMRFTLGRWLDAEGTCGIQASYFAIFDDESSGDYANGTAGVLGAGVGLPILARPFYNVGIAPNREDSRLVSFPGVVDGTIAINSSSEIQSGSLLARHHVQSDSSGRFDVIGGYRYFRLREGLLIRENQTRTEAGVPIPVGATYAYEDYFRAENEFHGGDLGVIAQRWRGLWTVEVRAQVALGNLHRSASVSGTNTIDTPPAGGGVTTAGGLLALPTNSGTRTADDFAVLPEVGINLRYDPSETFSLNVGYTLLALNDVTRTGELIDRVVNSTQTDGGALVGAARPTSMFSNQTDFWAQGFHVGATILR